MKKNLRSIILPLIVIVAALALTVSNVTKLHPAATETLSVQATPNQAGPRVIAQNPVAGQRLSPSATIQITFDRAMDQNKTSAAFSLLGPDGKVVPGNTAWPNAQTFEFTPGSKLQFDSEYRGVFSTAAAALDGTTPANAIELDFTTIESLKVGQVFPAADAEDIDQTTNITVIFNHPVVPLTIKEVQSDLPQPVELSPQIKGQGQWVNSSVYVYQPEQPLLSGIRYTVRVGAGLSDTGGNALEESFVSQFTTRAAAVTNFALKNGAENPPLDNVQNVLLDQAFVVTFTQPMNPDSVAGATTAVNYETGAQAPLNFNWNEDFTVLTLTPRGRYAIASYYDLRISQTAQAADGGALKDGLAVRFSTVSLPQVLKIVPPSTKQGFDDTLKIQFASPMRLDSLKNRIVLTPAPKNAPQWYYNDYDNSYSTYDLEPDTHYIVRVLPGATDIYGNTIRTEASLNFFTVDLPPYAQLIVPWTSLVYRAQGPQEVYFEYTNVDSAVISLYPLTFDEFGSLVNDRESGDGVSVVNFRPQVQPLNEWKPDMQVPRNRLNRLNIKLQDQKGNALAPGYYLIGVKGSPLGYTGNFYQGFPFIVATDNITFKSTSSEGLAWITDLESGQPQAKVSVTFYDKDMQQVGGPVVTDQNGLAYLKDIHAPAFARAEGTNHLAFVSANWGSGVWAGDFGIVQNFYASANTPFVYLYTDRPVYRPGQDVYFKGLVRQNDDLHYSLLKNTQLYVTIEQSGQQVYAKSLPLSELGNISDNFKLSDGAALGTYTISVRASKDADPFGTLDFRVADYHKPTFQVNVSADKTDILANGQVKFSLDAAYYSGGNAGGAKVDWFTEAAPFTFTPDSKYSQFNFMDWDRDLYYRMPSQSVQAGTLAEGRAVTDAHGHLDLSQSIDLGQTKSDQLVTLNVNITDRAGDLVSGGTSVIAHQSEWYAGIRSLSYVGAQGKEQPFEIVVLDWDSNPVANQPVTVQFVERKWFSVQKQDRQGQLSWVTSVKDAPVSQKTVTTGADGKAQVSFIPPEGGVYKAIALVSDSKGNKQQSSAYTWVASDQYIAWRQSNDRTFSLIADKDSYSSGDTAEILIAQPFQGDVYALVTYERGHIYKQDVVLLSGNSTIYKLPITSDMAPMAYVSATVVSGTHDAPTPDFKIGMVRINVDTSQQALDVKVTSDKQNAGPGDSVTYTITTKDQNGKPVSADASLAVVDKAALALAPSNSGRILDSFYPVQALSVQTALGLVANADDFNAQYRESIPEGGGSGGGGEDVSYGIITVRQDFKDTAFFRAQVTTDSNGAAQVTVKLPENLTTWVADARAATSDGRVGQAADELVSAKPLFVELQTPRFFVAGDRARVGAVIHNHGAAPLKVNVGLEAQGVTLITPTAQTVEVAAQSQAYVTWDLNVNVNASRVDLTAQAASGSFNDSSKPALGTLPGQGIPVYTYSAVETVGTSGILATANSITEAIQLPTAYDYNNAQLDISLSPSLAASLQDGLTYLKDYPYSGMEQIVSSFLPNVITTRALKLAGLPNASLQAALDQQINPALQRIYGRQKADGGWSWWDGSESDPQTSAYVALGLLEAKADGIPVSQDTLNNGLKYLNQNLPDLYQNASNWQYNRHAFMLYVLARGNALQAGQTNFIYEQRGSLDLYGKAYLAQAIYMLDAKDPRLQSLMSDLATASVLSAAGAHWEEQRQPDYWNWNTDTRTTAIVLNAFVQIDPRNPITANAVRWLMAHRQSGHWQSTQETAWSLMALTNWLTASKEYESNYRYAVGLNGESLTQGQVTKDNLTDTVELQVQMKDLLKDAVNYLVFTRGGGTGSLYYDAYLSATLPVESIQPLDQGMSLSRQYFTLTDAKKPVTEIRRGDLVRVRLTIVVPAALHYVVIEDPLPAGLEAVDVSIKTDTAVPTKYTVQDYNDRGWGWWFFTHTELRDEKIVLSADYLPAGAYVYTYLARASAVGTFKVIPPTASEVYFPDVGGRGAGSVFVVKP